jgi:hypothetical protein
MLYGQHPFLWKISFQSFVRECPMSKGDNNGAIKSDALTTALTTVIGVLTPLSSEERHRTVDAAMMFLGETAKAPNRKREDAPKDDIHDDDSSDYSPSIQKWMKKSGVTAAEFDQAFHFRADGTFDVLAVPGRSKKDQTLNTYVLTGLGKFVASGDRSFDDAMARGFCEKIGCYDQANHAAHIKGNGSTFSGDKKKGFSLSNVGVTRGIAIIKELAGGAAK